ncbi:MAG TPA: hypothetical protein VFG79_08620, partial [Solirubrobacter sp.]|nr:hypothetical protein [Solirubrobacter sp.]
MRLRLLTILACSTALAAAAPPAVAAAGEAPRADGASDVRGGALYRRGELVVRYGGAQAARAGAVPRTRVVHVARGRSVAAAARAWRGRPGVLSATPNYVAHVSG